MNIQITNIDKFENANGKLILELGWRAAWTSMQFYGGPYDGKPARGVFGVSVREERMSGRQFDVHLPIVDFQVPKPQQRQAVEQALKKTFSAALDGKDIWIGCMGGMGRTGLFMAIMVKAAGIADPVGFVRKNYYNHAVETDAQKAYVENFDTKELTRWLNRECWKRYLKRLIGIR